MGERPEEIPQTRKRHGEKHRRLGGAFGRCLRSRRRSRPFQQACPRSGGRGYPLKTLSTNLNTYEEDHLRWNGRGRLGVFAAASPSARQARFGRGKSADREGKEGRRSDVGRRGTFLL